MKTTKLQRTRLTLAASLVTALLATGSFALAEEGVTDEGTKPGHGFKHKGHRAEMLKQFDKDGDGQLSDDERAAAKEAFQAKMLEKYDTDGDGQLSADEKSKIEHRRGGEGKRHRPLPPEVLKQYDKDGDGQLSKEERKEARQAFREKRLEKFDTNGDGELSDEERAAARASRGDRQGRPGTEGTKE